MPPAARKSHPKPLSATRLTPPLAPCVNKMCLPALKIAGLEEAVIVTLSKLALGPAVKIKSLAASKLTSVAVAEAVANPPANAVPPMNCTSLPATQRICALVAEMNALLLKAEPP